MYGITSGPSSLSMATAHDTKNISVQQAMNALKNCDGLLHISLLDIGFMLGLPWHECKKLRNGEQDAKRMCEKAQEQQLLTASNLYQAIYLAISPQYGKKAALNLGIIPVKVEGKFDPEQLGETVDWSATIPPKNAYWLCDTTCMFESAIEMGLGEEDLIALLSSGASSDHKCYEVLWKLHERHLLTYVNFVSAQKKLQGTRCVKPITEKWGALEQRQPDYRPITTDRFAALTQKISLRDLVAVFRDLPTLPLDCAAISFCGDSSIYRRQYSNGARDSNLRTQTLCECFYERLQNNRPITMNDVLRFLYLPDIRKIATAQQLEAQVTGKPIPESLSDQALLRMDCIQNLKTVGLKLGLSEARVDSALEEGSSYVLKTGFNLLYKAKCEGRLTKENLVYALHESGNKDYADNIPELKGVKGEPMPAFERPVYLTDEELGNVSSVLAPMAVEPTSSAISQYEFSRLPLARNAYWIGRLLGLDPGQLHRIEQTEGMSSKSAVLLEMLYGFGYESGHLYGALQVIEDKEALEAFPVHLSGAPSKPLCDFSPDVKRAHIQFVCANLMKENPHDFGVALGLRKEHIIRAIQSHQHFPQRQVLAMLDFAFNFCYFRNNDETVQTIFDVVRGQGGDELKIKLPDAFYWLDRSQMKANPSMAPEQSELYKAEMEYETLLNQVTLSFIDVPKDFVCPITCAIIKNPIRVKTGKDNFHYFEESAFRQWFDVNPTHPLTRETINWDEDVTQAPELRLRIKDWLQQTPKKKD